MMRRTLGACLGGDDARRPPGFGLESVVLDDAAEFRIGRRELFAVNCHGGAGRTRCAGEHVVGVGQGPRSRPSDHYRHYFARWPATRSST